ncbi:hypothetical protein [Saccharopolyspora rosea]|uniref:Secreted protein n=1 Tax=Saccharopolyspora rosea TaxID=524884 RepID=A0ABW3FWQ1_9PSEU|nr:hypothetical protein [Saccharopolyspora rosea]
MSIRRVLAVVLLAVVVLAAAAAGGLALRRLYPDAAPERTEQPAPDGPEPLITFRPDVLAHPDFPTVRWVLETYFNAINFRQYDTWKTTVVRAKWRELPEKTWRQAYSSTHDGDVVLQRIEPDPDGTLRVMLTFTSTQDPDKAPSSAPSPCLRWNVVWLLVPEDGAFKLDVGNTANSIFQPC